MEAAVVAAAAVVVAAAAAWMGWGSSSVAAWQFAIVAAVADAAGTVAAVKTCRRGRLPEGVAGGWIAPRQRGRQTKETEQWDWEFRQTHHRRRRPFASWTPFRRVAVAAAAVSNAALVLVERSFRVLVVAGFDSAGADTGAAVSIDLVKAGAHLVGVKASAAAQALASEPSLGADRPWMPRHCHCRREEASSSFSSGAAAVAAADAAADVVVAVLTVEDSVTRKAVGNKRMRNIIETTLPHAKGPQ